MRDLPKRLLTTIVAALLVSGLTACGDKKSTAQPGPETSTSAAPVVVPPKSTAAIKPKVYDDAFAGLRSAASHMPKTAAAIAGAMAKGPDIKGTFDSDAADLRANLTHLLTEHVYLVGLLVDTAYTSAPDSQRTEAAREAVDDNSDSLAKLVEAVSSDKDAETFLKAWTSHVDDFVDYANAARADKDVTKQKALDNLRLYRDTAGEFFATLTKNKVRASAVTRELRTHVDELIEAIDSFADADGEAFDKLKIAAEHMPQLAAVLTGGFVKFAEIDGDPGDEAAHLRADLARMFTEHVYLAGLTVFTAYTDRKGTVGEVYKSAIAALEDNSQNLADAVGAVSTSSKRFTFLTQWRSHIRDFEDFAKAAAKNDQKAKDVALDNLDRYRGTAGKFFADITKDAISPSALGEALLTHVETLAGAIDALAAELSP